QWPFHILRNRTPRPRLSMALGVSLAAWWRSEFTYRCFDISETWQDTFPSVGSDSNAAPPFATLILERRALFAGLKSRFAQRHPMPPYGATEHPLGCSID